MATKTIASTSTNTGTISMTFVELENLIKAAAGVTGSRISFKAVKPGFTATDFNALQGQGYSVQLIVEDVVNDPGVPVEF